jgi:CRISPR-associated protein Cas5a/b/c
MIGFRIEGLFHWGYWSRIPGTSKIQLSTTVPPPTSLIGALSFPLARRGLLTHSSKQVTEFIIQERAGEFEFKSSASILANAVLGCSAYLGDTAMQWTDISKYNTLLFQRKAAGSEEEKAVGGRRYLSKYLSGVIRVERVYYPSGKLTIVYLFDDAALNAMFQEDWHKHIQDACWSITRIGSRESLFSVTGVREIWPKSIQGETRTTLYFPSEAGTPKEGETSFRRENFWTGGWARNEPAKFKEYIVPASKSFLESRPIDVVISGAAYQFGPEEVLLVG